MMRLKLLLCSLTILTLCHWHGVEASDTCSLSQLTPQMRQLDGQLVQIEHKVDALSGNWRMYFCKQQLAELRRQLEDARGILAKTSGGLVDAGKSVEQQISELQGQNNEARKRINELETDGFPWGWIVVGLLCPILIVVGFLSVVGLRKPAVAVAHEEGPPKCPRCGWKYTRGETKCRNCGTRF